MAVSFLAYFVKLHTIASSVCVCHADYPFTVYEVLPKSFKQKSCWRGQVEAVYSHPCQSIIMKTCDANMETRNCLEAETNTQ